MARLVVEHEGAGSSTARRCQRTQARSGGSTRSDLNWLKRSDIVVRAGGTCTWTSPVGDEEDQPALHALVVQAEDLACLAGLLLDHLRVGGERRRRPGEDRVTRLPSASSASCTGPRRVPLRAIRGSARGRQRPVQRVSRSDRIGLRFETSRIGGAATLRATRPLEGMLSRPGLRPCPEVSGLRRPIRWQGRSGRMAALADRRP